MPADDAGALDPHDVETGRDAMVPGRPCSTQAGGRNSTRLAPVEGPQDVLDHEVSPVEERVVPGDVVGVHSPDAGTVTRSRSARVDLPAPPRPSIAISRGRPAMPGDRLAQSLHEIGELLDPPAGGLDLTGMQPHPRIMPRHLRVLVIPTDVADAEQVERAAERVEAELGAIDVWVNGLRGRPPAAQAVLGRVEHRRDVARSEGRPRPAGPLPRPHRLRRAADVRAGPGRPAAQPVGAP